VSVSIKAVMQPAGPEKAVGIITAAFLKEPTDPQWENTPEYKDWLAWMKKYNTSANLADAAAGYGYSVTQTMVAVLKACGDNLTRENIMKQAASIHSGTLPMLLPGITVSTSADDFAPIKQMQLALFDGTTWRLFGDGPSAKSNARNRACRPDVKRMVAENRNRTAQRLEITLDELIKRADEIFKLAMASAQLGAAVNALKELGILSGKRMERGEPGEFDRMSDGELQQAIADRAEQLGFIPKNKTQH
jgi:hypothetical protein